MTEDETELALFFADAQKHAPIPDAKLVARVLSDANTVQGQPQPESALPKPGFWAPLRHIADLLGGWGVVAGLSAAAVAGVWIGYTGSAGLGAVTADFLTLGAEYELDDMTPSIDLLLAEGS